MKNAWKFVFKFSIFLILLIGISSCNGCEDFLNDDVTDDEVVTSKEVKPIIVSEKEAIIRFDNYRKHRVDVIKAYENNGRRLCDSVPQNPQYLKSKKQDDKTVNQEDKAKFVPVEYIHYDFELFKKYIQFIEQETKKGGADISTIRVYFANYSESEKKEDKRNRNTVVFVPTINIDGEESTYYLSDKGNEGKIRPVLLDDLFEQANDPGFVGTLPIPNEGTEASILPNVSGLMPSSPPPIIYRQSVWGNEGDRNP